MTSPSLFYREIPLTQGKVALVDVEDYEELSKFNWFAYRNKQGKYYAARKEKVGVNRWTTRYMARQVLGFPPFNVDHVDPMDTLNNTKLNLRPATKQQNAANTGLRKDNKSGAKGVRWHKAAGKWMASIRVSGKDIYLGLFIDPEKAGQAYGVAAVKYFGEYARTNIAC